MQETNTANEVSDVDQDITALPPGAQWLRWEPHIHGPGTVLNDQFKGSNAFQKYLSDLEAVAPVLKAIGITDYYSTEVYEL